MQREQAFKLGRTITVVAGVLVFSDSIWAIFPAILGFVLVWYGSLD
jgi:hypothetical protein